MSRTSAVPCAPRVAAAGLTFALILTAARVPAAERPIAAPGAGATSVRADFDGDGFDDLAVGVPGETVGGRSDAGAVNVLYGSGSGLGSGGDQLWTQDTPGVKDTAEQDDAFGQAVAAGDFNGDGYDDLAVGVPEEDVGAEVDAGAVQLFEGSPGGLTANGNRFWHQDVAGIKGVAEASSFFGQALAAGDMGRSSHEDLAVGAPWHSVGGVSDAGTVSVFYGSNNGPSKAGDQIWHQNRTGTKDTAEDLDLFGNELVAADFGRGPRAELVVGVSGEVVGGKIFAGAVHVFYGATNGLTAAGNQFWHQGTTGVGGAPDTLGEFGTALAAGDFGESRHADLAVGSSARAAGVADAGTVNVFFGSANGIEIKGGQYWHQDSPGVRDAAEPVDFFGVALSAGNFGRGRRADLAIGVPQEGLGGLSLAGAVNVLYGTGGGLTARGDQFLSQDSPGIKDSSEAQDKFGSALASGDFDGDGFDDLSIGVPLENLGAIADAGAVNVLYGSGSGLGAARDQFWNQDSPGVKGVAGAGDVFGDALA